MKTFGAVIVEKDERDFDLSLIGSSVQRPDVYRPDYSNLPVYDQSKIPACGAHAGASLKLVQEIKDNPNFSPRYLWSEIKKIDGYPPEWGTDIYSIMKTLKDKGVCDYSLAGNDTSLSLATYTNFKSNPQIDSNAVLKEISAFATIFNPTFDQIKQAIYQFGGVILLMRVGKNMYADKNGITYDPKRLFPLSTTNFPMDSGHFVTCIGYDEKYIYFRNSWNTDWGLKGDGYFAEDYIPFVNCIATAIDKYNVPPESIPQFTKNLYLGVQDPQVKKLQIYLNNHGYKLADYGAGSPGNETDYYGTLTKNAVIRLQVANNISPAVGYLGPLTRAFVNR